MTKPWQRVRKDICAMYKRGESLEAIQKSLSQRGFHAHIRSYRSRIAAWGMKRSDVSNVKKRQDKPPPLPGEGVGSTEPVNVGTALPQVHEMMTEDLGYHSSDALEPNGNHHGLASAGVERTEEESLRMLYGSLSYVIQHNMKPNIDWALRSHEVVEGKEWILHFALRAPPAPVDWETTLLEELLCFLKRKNISLDIPDSQGHSPIELAIFGNKVKELETLLRHGADANRIGDRGLSPLQTALLSSSSADTIRCLLNHGADTQRYFPPTIAGSAPETIAGDNTPLAFVVKKVELGVDRVHWLTIMGVFAHYATSTDLGFSMDDGRQQSVLRSFIRDWQRSASPDLLFKAVSPFLVALLRRPIRLDPTKPICDNQSLFQLAIFHPPVDSDPRHALARLIVQESDLDLFGTKMLECILRHCPENKFDCEAVVKLVGQLLLRPFRLRPEVTIVETLLQHVARWPPEHRLAILGILIERRRVDCLIESSRPENRWRLLDYIAAFEDESIRYEFAEYLMQVRAHSSDSLTLFEDILWDIRNKVFTVTTLADLHRILRFPAEDPMVANCVLHVATKLEIQALRVDQPHVRERLRFLLDIRQAYHLPDVQMSGELVRLDLGPSVPLQSVLHTTFLQRTQNAVYGSWF